MKCNKKEEKEERKIICEIVVGCGEQRAEDNYWWLDGFEGGRKKEGTSGRGVIIEGKPGSRRMTKGGVNKKNINEMDKKRGGNRYKNKSVEAYVGHGKI